MGRHVLRRLVWLPLTVWVVVTLVFFLLRVVPADPARAMLGEGASPADVERLRERLGLNQPLPMQYLDFLRALVSGDFGTSLANRQPVTALVGRALPYTLELVVAAGLLAVALGVPLGILAATHRGTWLDSVIVGVASLPQALPVFYVGILLLLVFSVWLGWFPVLSSSGAIGLGDRLRELVLPATTLALLMATYLIRSTRTAFVEALRQDYIRTARGKGLSLRAIQYHHGLPNTLLPIAAIIGSELIVLLGGTALIEVVFTRPGLGSVLVLAIQQRDYPVVQFGLLVYSIVVVLMNLLLDLVFGVLDPRVRYE